MTRSFQKLIVIFHVWFYQRCPLYEALSWDHFRCVEVLADTDFGFSIGYRVSNENITI